MKLLGAMKRLGGRRGPGFQLGPVDLTLRPLEPVALIGPSGGGKSTLLDLMSGLLHPDQGSVEVDGTSMTALRGRRLSAFRREHFCHVSQDYGLVGGLTAWENVALPQLLAGRRPDWRAVEKALHDVGVTVDRHRRSGEMSGGQQQRVAVARALLGQPRYFIADEPTAALDEVTQESILALIRTTCQERGMTLVVATHDLELAATCERVLVVAGGGVTEVATVHGRDSLAAALRKAAA